MENIIQTSAVGIIRRIGRLCWLGWNVRQRGRLRPTKGRGSLLAIVRLRGGKPVVHISFQHNLISDDAIQTTMNSFLGFG